MKSSSSSASRTRNNIASCGLLCLIAAGFFGSMLYIMLSYGDESKLKNMENTLNEEQTTVYRKIVYERMTIYIYGLVLGLLAGFTYISYYPIRNTLGICAFVVIILGVLYLFYGLYPKTTYMLNHMNTSEQRDSWLAIYRDMKYRSHFGFLLGAVAFVLFGCVLRK